MSQAEASERRILERYTIPLKVFDQETGALLGCTENINAGGLMLVSKTQIPTMTEFQILIEIPGSEAADRISMTAFTAWKSFSDSKPVYYCTGFHFVDPSEDKLDSIQAYIDEHS